MARCYENLPSSHHNSTEVLIELGFEDLPTATTLRLDLPLFVKLMNKLMYQLHPVSSSVGLADAVSSVPQPLQHLPRDLCCSSFQSAALSMLKIPADSGLTLS